MAAVLKSAVIGTSMISKQHLSFLQTCDRIYELSEGQLKQSGTYREIIMTK